MEVFVLNGILKLIDGKVHVSKSLLGLKEQEGYRNVPVGYAEAELCLVDWLHFQKRWMKMES